MRPGLEGVIVAESVLSHAEPERGMLWVRGRPIPYLVEQGYEGSVALLWEGFAGHNLTRAGMSETFGAARQQAFGRIESWLSAAAGRPIEEAVRVALAMLPDDAAPASIPASLAVFIAAALRQAAGRKPVAPDPGVPMAADVLRMLHGVAPSEADAKILDTYFAAMAESGLSASAFAGRVVASTHASLVSAVLAAWCAFTGPLHGGAPGPTLDLLDAAAAADNLDAWIERKLNAGERLMGFGHRVFKGNDPRAAAMRAALARANPKTNRLAFVAHLEKRVAAVVERVKPGRRLPANVEVMAALLMDAVRIPRQAFTAIFAITRSTGWIAHALEQRQTGRMIRPASAYVGPKLD